MYDFGNNDLQTPKQVRAQKTLQDIAESTEKLLKSGEIESFTVEKLSELSGYSVGGIFHYFKKRDDIFVHVFMTKRRQKLEELAEIIRRHNPQSDVASFITTIVNSSIEGLGRFRSKMMQLMLRTYLKRAKNPENFDLIISPLIDDWIHLVSQDQTNTFAVMDRDELVINIKALHMAIRSPFYQSNPIAGSEKHKMIAIRLGMKLFSKYPQHIDE